jgi:hypothetical protein
MERNLDIMLRKICYLKGILSMSRFTRKYSVSATFISNPKENHLLINLNNKKYSLNTNFLEWLAGFMDAESNVNISLKFFKENKYNSLMLTFQIGLHIEDLHILKFIQEN